MSILVSSNNANGTCTVCHSRTKNINDYSRNADIIISAIGVPNFLTSEMIKEDSIIIDVGINRIDSDNEKGYKIVGDADYDSVFDKVSKIPVFKTFKLFIKFPAWCIIPPNALCAIFQAMEHMIWKNDKTL